MVKRTGCGRAWPARKATFARIGRWRVAAGRQAAAHHQRTTPVRNADRSGAGEDAGLHPPERRSLVASTRNYRGGPASEMRSNIGPSCARRL